MAFRIARNSSTSGHRYPTESLGNIIDMPKLPADYLSMKRSHALVLIDMERRYCCISEPKNVKQFPNQT
jgi:hypothetical protein